MTDRTPDPTTDAGAAHSPLAGWVSARVERLRGLGDDRLAAAVMLAATLVALVWANIGHSYETFWHTDASISVGTWAIDLSLQHWVNDALMTLFFFVVGLEVKREVTVGELTDRNRAIVPVFGAIAGLVVPALLFWVINLGTEHANAWGVVVSTDTAFVLGALALVGPRSGGSRLRVFMLALAVADDIGALAIIAFFYTDHLNFGALAIGVIGLAIIWQLRRLHVWRGVLYLIVAVFTWVAFYESGVHPTLAGVLIAMILPVYPPRRSEVERADEISTAFRQSPNSEYAREAQLAVARAISVNERLLRLFEPYTSFLVVPIFAMANAGIVVDGESIGNAIGSPLTWGVVVGLVVGKFIGISGATAVLAKLRPGSLPPGLPLSSVYGGAALGGIGFTISLFIVDLAIDDPLAANEARIGVVLAAVLSVALGWLMFRLEAARHPQREEPGTVLLRPVDVVRDHIRGPIHAPLTLVEYGDFECPFCSRATGSIWNVRNRFGDDLRYVFRHLPKPAEHPHSELAARAAEAAGLQDKFWEMHDVLFRNSEALTEDDVFGYAEDLGLDMERFEFDLRRGTVGRRVDDDLLDAQVSDVVITPTFYLGHTGEPLRRHVGPFDGATLIRALEQVEATIPVEAAAAHDDSPAAPGEADRG